MSIGRRALAALTLWATVSCSKAAPVDERFVVEEPTTQGVTTSVSSVTTAVPSFADTFARVATGVYRIDTTFCDGRWSQGTGFLVEPDLLLTAAHVIGDASTVELARDGKPAGEGTVVGTNAARDLALIRLERPSNGHLFTIDDSTVRVGQEVASLGHPSGLPLGLTSGRISSLNYDYDGVKFHQTDASVNPGGSGGPLIDSAGNVVGLVDWKFVEVEGIAFVVTAQEIQAYLRSPSRFVIDVSLDCAVPGSDAWTSDPDLVEVAIMFEEYSRLINASKEAEAYELFIGDRLKERVSQQEFVYGNSTSTLVDIEVLHAQWSTESSQAAQALVTFVSYQNPEFGPDGQTCSVWRLTYDLSWSGEGWRIEKASNEPGSPTPCTNE